MERNLHWTIVLASEDQRLARRGRGQTRGFRACSDRGARAFPLTRILIITDAWLPQVNGVVRVIEALVKEAPALGVEIKVLAANEFRTVPLPTYPQVRVAVTRPREVQRRIEELKPDFIHIATEGPLGLCAWFACRRAGRPFTTCYHTRFPEYLAARRVAPSRFVYALLRRFHNAGSGMMVSTETLGRELDMRGFVRLMRWSHGVDCDLFRPRAGSIFQFPRPIFLTCARVAIEKNSMLSCRWICRVQRSSLGTDRRGRSFRPSFPEPTSSARCATRGWPPLTRAPTYSCSRV